MSHNDILINHEGKGDIVFDITSPGGKRGSIQDNEIFALYQGFSYSFGKMALGA